MHSSWRYSASVRSYDWYTRTVTFRTPKGGLGDWTPCPSPFSAYQGLVYLIHIVWRGLVITATSTKTFKRAPHQVCARGACRRRSVANLSVCARTRWRFDAVAAFCSTPLTNDSATTSNVPTLLRPATWSYVGYSYLHRNTGLRGTRPRYRILVSLTVPLGYSVCYLQWRIPGMWMDLLPPDSSATIRAELPNYLVTWYLRDGNYSSAAILQNLNVRRDTIKLQDVLSQTVHCLGLHTKRKSHFILSFYKVCAFFPFSK